MANAQGQPTYERAGVAAPGAVFRVREVSKTYRMGEVEVHALRRVNLELYEGEFVVLLGPSGSGKSTLLNILGGLDVPSSGEVWFRNRDLAQANDAILTRFRREAVGFIFQFYNLIPSLTARENVALVTEIASHPFTPEEALELVGLGDRLDHFHRIRLFSVLQRRARPGIQYIHRQTMRIIRFKFKSQFHAILARLAHAQDSARTNFNISVLEHLQRFKPFIVSVRGNNFRVKLARALQVVIKPSQSGFFQPLHAFVG